MGTSTNYKAPTSPQWRNLKNNVTRQVSKDTSNSDDIDTQDTSNSDDIDIQDTSNSNNIDTQNTSNSDDIDIQGIVNDFVKVCYGSSQSTGSAVGSGSKDRSGGGGANSGRSGGGGGVTARKQAVRNVAQNIGGFFSSIADSGFREAFEQAGLGRLEGKSVHEIACSLLDYLGGPSSTLDQVDARKALTDLMGEILHDLDSPEAVEEAMENRSHGESFADMIRSFFGHYINAQFIRAFYERVIARNSGTQIFDKIRNYIRAAVKFEVGHQEVSEINWSGDQGEQLIDKIFQNTLEVFSL